MCGIAGMYGARLPRSGGAVVLKDMLRLIRHRGPDEAGIYLSDQACLGTVRLSIVGISSGQQPLCDEEQRYCLCYNGEIYNYLELRKELKALGYRFVTDSDTEVVLQAWRAWGARSLPRLNGAFAFCLYDRLRNVLYLARDRYGKRPLFYVQHGADWLFASEMKAFLAIKGFQFQLDQNQLASILTLWTPIGEQSGFVGIRQVPQGSYVTVSGSHVEIQRYYEVDFAPRREIRSESQAVEEIRATLQQAVKLRLRSDVEVGMYLSGGLDSSILASILAAQIADRLRTYSVTFADREFDESSDQHRMAGHIGARHSALHVTDRMIVDNFPAAVFHAEVPVFRTALVPMYLLSRRVRADGIKVVMTGEGADEAFLGYDLFKETLLRCAWDDLEDSQKLARLRLLYPYLGHYGEVNAPQLLGLYQQFARERHPGLFSHELRIQNGLFSKRLLRAPASGLDAMRELIAAHAGFAQLSPMQKAQWLEYQSLLPGYLLSSQGDRMTLAHSVENRCPFLDPHVVELSAAVNLKFDDGADEKYLLRKSFASELPEANLRKRKHPYRAPDSRAFVASCPDYLELLLADRQLRDIGLLDPTFCRRLLGKIFDTPSAAISTKENQTFIFLLSIALLHQQFVKRGAVAPGPPVDDIMVKVVDITRGLERHAHGA
jgi:asparagine synthase (glutamine-hydrolysing)